MRVVFGFPIYISLAFHCVWMNWLGRVIYTLAEFLFYILVCITLRWADKKSASHTSCLHSHTSHTSFFYILMLLILLVLHSRLHNIKQGRQKVRISYSVSLCEETWRRPPFLFVFTQERAPKIGGLFCKILLPFCFSNLTVL